MQGDTDFSQPAAADDGESPLLGAFARLSRTYELILHAAGEGIFSLDLGGRITFANPEATRMLGWPMEDMLGRTACEVVHGTFALVDEDCPFAAPIVAEHHRRRHLFYTREGEERVVEYSLALIRDDGACLGAVLVFSDISERERAEAALKESNQRLSATRDQLLQAEKLAAIGQLAAGVAHEINTPLGFVGANISLLGQHFTDLLGLVAAYEAAGGGKDDPRVAAARKRCDLEFLQDDAPALVAETSAGLVTVGKIVRELREFASAGESGEWQWTELPRLLDMALGVAQSREGVQGTVARHYDPELPQVFCLAPRLGQAFAAVILNALQAVARDGLVAIRARPGGGGEVVIEVEDNGIGIPASDLPRVRDPFFTTRPVGRGIGMGLSVADITVRRHGGRLDIASQAGVGTRVTITLPVRPPVVAGEA